MTELFTSPALVSQLSSLGYGGRTVRRYEPYIYTLDFASIAAATSLPAIGRIDQSSAFVVTRYAAVAWIVGAVGSAVALTGLNRLNDGNTGTNQNTLPHFNGLRVQLQDSRGIWSSGPIRLANLVGNFEQAPLDVARALAAGEQVNATLFNDCAVAVGAQIALVGTRLYF